MDVLDDLRWLVSDAAAPWLAEAQAAAPLAPAVLRRWAITLGAERARLVVEQAELRRRGLRKFAAAERMFFDRTALEQATDETTAAWHAARFPAGAPIADLGCGIGGDLAAIARRGPTVGVERSAARALLAAANLAALGRAAGRVVRGDATQLPLGPFSAWRLDPDRRPQGRRTAQPAGGEPGAAAITTLLDHHPTAALKLAPAAEPPAEWPPAEREWIGCGGECRQQTAWFGELAREPGRRAATVLSPHAAPRTLRDRGRPPPPLAEAVGAWVYEPHAAVLAAGLAGELAAEAELALLLPGGGYLTGGERLPDPAWAAFEVLETLPCDRKRLKAALRARRIGRLEVKKRGLDLDPERLRRELRVAGDESATLLLAGRAGGAWAILARRRTLPEGRAGD